MEKPKKIKIDDAKLKKLLIREGEKDSKKAPKSEIKEIPIEKEKLSSKTLEDSVFEPAAMSFEDFGRFLSSIRKVRTVPVTQSPENAPFAPQFIQPVSDSSDDNDRREGDPFKYQFSTGGENDPKYISDTGEFRPVQRVDFENAGRNLDQRFSSNQKDMFIQSEASKISSEHRQYDVSPVEQIDLNKVGRKNILEQDQKQYEFSSSGR